LDGLFVEENEPHLMIIKDVHICQNLTYLT